MLLGSEPIFDQIGITVEIISEMVSWAIFNEVTNVSIIYSGMKT